MFVVHAVTYKRPINLEIVALRIWVRKRSVQQLIDLSAKEGDALAQQARDAWAVSASQHTIPGPPKQAIQPTTSISLQYSRAQIGLRVAAIGNSSDE